MISSLAHLSNDELLVQVKHLAAREREATASLIAHLAELDQRRLYLDEGYPSLFAYCTQVLHLSEGAAYRRIEAARMVRKFPVVLDMVEQGSVNLTTVNVLAAHLTDKNHREVLKKACHKSKRQVEELRACLDPQPPVVSSIRRLPALNLSTKTLTHTEAMASRPSDDKMRAESTLPPLAVVRYDRRPAVITPLAPERYKVQFTASGETFEKLRLAQDLLRHEVPNGDPAVIFDRALTALLHDLAKKKLAATDRPRESRQAALDSRRIPAKVKRAVWLRDGGCCAFVGCNGTRCTERGFIEFHHVKPYAKGASATEDNIQLRCRRHNTYEAELDFVHSRTN